MLKRCVFLLIILGLSCTVFTTEGAEPAPNGIKLPQGYRNWQWLNISHRTDKSSLRLILGNPIAIKAAAEGKTNPWPEGSILAKLAWQDQNHPNFKDATIPGKLSHVEFMIRDSQRYSDTNGWGYARWLGTQQKPYGKTADFAQECATCHLQAQSTGYVFTQRPTLP